MKSRHSILVMPALLAITLAGCGESTPPTFKCVAGTSNIDVTGDVSAKIGGCATYGITAALNPLMVLELRAGNLTSPGHTIVLMRHGARLATGTYSVGAAAETQNKVGGMLALDGGDSDDPNFILASGSLTITSSSSGTLSGTLAMTALDYAGKTVSLSGDFTAKCVDTANSNC